MEAAERSFQIGLGTMIRMLGRTGPDADETRALAIDFMMASADRTNRSAGRPWQGLPAARH